LRAHPPLVAVCRLFAHRTCEGEATDRQR
jgi:hypothetical protein